MGRIEPKEESSAMRIVMKANEIYFSPLQRELEKKYYNLWNEKKKEINKLRSMSYEELKASKLLLKNLSSFKDISYDNRRSQKAIREK